MEPNRNITKETGTEIQAVGKRLHLLLSLWLFPLDICVDEGATAVECILNVLFSLYLVLRRWILKRNKSPGFSYRVRKWCQCRTPEAINDMNVRACLQCTSTNKKKKNTHTGASWKYIFVHVPGLYTRHVVRCHHGDEQCRSPARLRDGSSLASDKCNKTSRRSYLEADKELSSYLFRLIYLFLNV